MVATKLVHVTLSHTDDFRAGVRNHSAVELSAVEHSYHSQCRTGALRGENLLPAIARLAYRPEFSANDHIDPRRFVLF